MAIDVNNGYTELQAHLGHQIECVGYVHTPGDREPLYANVAIECETCSIVLYDYDNPVLRLAYLEALVNPWLPLRLTP